MVAKGPEAFRTISEVADELDLPQHVLRFWETRFTQIRPMKRGGGRRYYRPDDVDLLRGIRALLYGEGYTIRGVQRLLKEQGPRFVAAAGRGRADRTAETRLPDLARSSAPKVRAAPDGRRPQPPGVSSDADEDETIAFEDDSAFANDPEAVDAASPEADPHGDAGDAVVAAVDVGDRDFDSGEASETATDTDTAEASDEDIGGDEDANADDSSIMAGHAAGPAGVPYVARSRATPRASSAVPASTGAASTSGSNLSREDVRRLHGTLTQLLEIKRMLDAARS